MAVSASLSIDGGVAKLPTEISLWWVVLACSAATFFWRALGVLVTRRIDADGALFRWVTCVSYAMVAGLIFRMIVMPESELANLSETIRICCAPSLTFGPRCLQRFFRQIPVIRTLAPHHLQKFFQQTFQHSLQFRAAKFSARGRTFRPRLLFR